MYSWLPGWKGRRSSVLTIPWTKWTHHSWILQSKPGSRLYCYRWSAGHHWRTAPHLGTPQISVCCGFLWDPLAGKRHCSTLAPFWYKKLYMRNTQKQYKAPKIQTSAWELWWMPHTEACHLHSCGCGWSQTAPGRSLAASNQMVDLRHGTYASQGRRSYRIEMTGSSQGHIARELPSVVAWKMVGHWQNCCMSSRPPLANHSGWLSFSWAWLGPAGVLRIKEKALDTSMHEAACNLMQARITRSAPVL